MHAELNGSTYTVTATSKDVCDFAAAWPCHGLDTDSEYVFEFSSANGDLVDLNALRAGRLESLKDGEDGAALAALSEDACRAGAEQLGLNEIIAVHFGNTVSPK